MKRILGLCLLCVLAVPSLAQTPTVVEKVVSPVKNANAAKAAQVNAALGKPAPSNVKVVAVPAAKPSAVVAKAPAKPSVVAVQPAAKPAVAVVQAKPVAAQKNAQAKSVAAQPKPAAPLPVVAVKPVPQGNKTPVAVKVPASSSKGNDPFKKTAQAQVKAAPAKDAKAKVAVDAKAGDKKAGAVIAVNENKPVAEKKPEARKFSAEGQRDPFVSPVVHMGAVGSGCSTGKRCLAIEQIALKGVVKSENGMIAVVVNALDKAYFLRENDPVFNGYVTKITSDSIVFKETFKDKLGKDLTRDVTKSISRPAA